MTPEKDRGDVPTSDPAPWTVVHHHVVQRLRALPDRGFLVLGERASEIQRPRGLRRLLARPAPSRFVQALRDVDQLGVECVGAASFGGPVEIDPETDRRLRALGWAAPGDAAYEPMGGPAYRSSWPATDPAGAADLLVGSLEVLGVLPTAVELRTGP